MNELIATVQQNPYFLLVIPLAGGLMYAAYLNSKWHTIMGDTKYDKAKVVSISFSPEHSDTSIVPTYVNGNFGVGLSSHTDPERDIVIVRGTKYKQIIFDDADLLSKVEQGQKVEIAYAEKFSYHEDRPRDLISQGFKILGIKVDNELIDASILEIKES